MRYKTQAFEAKNSTNKGILSLIKQFRKSI